MVHPGAFHGSRKEFLLKEKTAYSAGVIGGYAADALANIQRRYFKRYPIDLPHDVEPDSAALALVDDDAPDIEQVEPNVVDHGPEEYAAAMEGLEARRKTVAFRKAQIKRWLAYQHMKDHDMDPKESGAQNPYRILLHKLTGSTIHCPRLRTPVNVWRKTQREVIEAEVKVRAARLGTKRRGLAALRDKVAKEMFNLLSVEEREEWKTQAKEEHSAATTEWKRETEDALSKDPADRQRCIYGLVRFAQPILDLICEATGWKATLLVGGPEPAHGGRLNVISIHSGTTTGDVQMNFGRAERLRYKNVIVPIFGQFLQKCYTPEECRASALPEEAGFEALQSLDFDAQGANFDSIEPFVDPPATISAMNVSSSVPPDINATSVPHPGPMPSRSRHLSPAPASPCSPSSRSPTPALSVPLSPVHETPSPTSLISDMLRDEFPPSPFQRTPPVRAGAAATVGSGGDVTALEASGVPTSSVRENTRGQKRHAESDSMRGPQISKRTRTTNTRSLPLPASSRTTRSATKGGISTSQQSCPTSARSTHQATSSAVPLAAPPLTRGTRQTAAPMNSPAMVVANPGAPAWFSDALVMLQPSDVDLGDSWRTLISVWASFEKSEVYGGNTIGKLSAKHRPSILKDWIQRARSGTWRPTISNVSQLERDFVAWWTLLQPEWRVNDGGMLDVTRTTGSWEKLRQPGLNGLLSAIAGLFFWGVEVHGKATTLQKGWLRLVDDCISTLRQLQVVA